MKKVRSSQAAILVLKRVKQFFPVSIVNGVWSLVTIAKLFILDVSESSGYGSGFN